MNLIPISIFLLQLICTSVFAAEDLQIFPVDKKPLRKQGSKFFAECESKGENVHRVMWTNPAGQQITTFRASPDGENKKERIHTEESQHGHKGLNLYFQNIQKKDEGNYTCSASVDGKEVEEYFLLSVYKPISFTDTPAQQFLNEGEDSNSKLPTPLVCNVDSGPRLRITWKVNGTSIKARRNDTKYSFDSKNKGLLFVNNVTLSDGGNYECTASQISALSSQVDDFPINVTVHHKPKHVSMQERSYGYVNGVVNLTCGALAVPQANFTWLKDNVVVVEGDNFKIFTGDHVSVLQMMIENADMFGDYYCVAVNRLGTLERVVTLAKGEKPPMPKFELKEAEAEALLLNITAPPFPEMPVIGFKVEYKFASGRTEQWLNAKSREFKIGKSPYVLDDLKSNTAYAIRIYSKNVAGFSDATARMVLTTTEIESPNAAQSVTNSILLLFFTLKFYLFTVVF